VPSVTATASAPELTPRRRELLEAAVHVVADEGLRGLTHRAVDRRAGLPEGTCSAYLRTRQALQVAVTQYVATALTADVDRLAAELSELPEDCAWPEVRAQVVERTLALFERWLSEREVALTHLELSMEAPRNPAVAEALEASRARLVDVVDGILVARDREHGPHRAEALVAALDGLLLTAFQKPATERRSFLNESLTLVLHALTEPEA
jgi:DNA-binding transcriptional regulator YbjK